MGHKFPNIRDVPEDLPESLAGILMDIKECLELMLSRRTEYLPEQDFEPVNRAYIELPIEIEASGAKIYAGEGTPEGSVVANPGSIYLRIDGSTSTSFYVKESGTEATGWVAK